MPAHQRYRAPAGNGEVLAAPGFDAIPALVEENRRKLDRDDIVIGGLPLRELRMQARREVLDLASGGREPPDPDLPLLLAGHQPELSHPGVWVKNFALNGLARKVGGTPLNLIVDNDTLKSTSLRFPAVSGRGPKVHVEAVPFDRLDREEPYEDRQILDAGLFESFWGRSGAIWTTWPYAPLQRWAWLRVIHTSGTLGERFSETRQFYEHEWGCHNLELTVSRLSQTSAFVRFASHILDDLPRFREVYNSAICTYRKANGIRSENHPAPELAEGEAPFWVHSPGGRRERATATSDVRSLRPRALTLTLFARVCLGDFFIHGIGGGKYDEVTDAIIRDYFDIDPPAYQVLSATLHLPLPAFPSTEADVQWLEDELRDLTWNPQRHLPPGMLSRPDVRRLVKEKALLAANEPPHGDHAARRDWFRWLQKLTEELRPLVSDHVSRTESQLARARVEAHANSILQRRDYSWVLYPEETLRPFLQRFLEL